MKIFIRGYATLYELNVKLTDQIKQILQLLEKTIVQEQKSFKIAGLTYKSKFLQNQVTIVDYNIQEKQTLKIMYEKNVPQSQYFIHQTVIVNKPLLEKKNYDEEEQQLLTISQIRQQFAKNQIRNQIIEPLEVFKSSSPVWWKMGLGLNLVGKCVKLTCPAYNKQVLIQKGLGNFNIIKEVYCSNCPICQQTCQEVNNICLYLCKSKRTGMIKGINSPKTLQNQTKRADMFLILENTFKINRDWIYLEMEITPCK